MLASAFTIDMRSQYILHLLPSAGIRQSLVAANVLYTLVAHHSLVVRIFQEMIQRFLVYRCGRDFGRGTGCQPTRRKIIRQITYCPISGSKLIKRQLDQRSPLLIQDDCAFLAPFFIYAPDIDIPKWSTSGGPAVFYFLVHTLFDFGGEVL